MEQQAKSLENAYIAGKMTYEELAKAHGLEAAALRAQGRREGWHKKRLAWRKAQGMSGGDLQTLMDTAVLLCQVLEDMVQDTDQFHLHMRTVRTKSKDENGEVVEDSVPETVWLDKVDIAAVRAVSGVLRELTDVIRDIKELPTQSQKHAQRLAEEKMALLREQSEDSQSCGIRLSREAEEFAE